VTLTQSDVNELLDAIRAGGDIDVIRKGVELVLQALIEAEATDRIGAGRYERTETRTTQRNGHRDRLLATKAGDVELRIPKLRQGSFFPSILERRRRIDRALFAVVMEAYVQGVSTRKVDDLVTALGAASGISKSEVSRICSGLDDEMAAFRTRRLDHVEFPYLFADATYLKGRVGGQVVSRAVVVVTAVTATGEREVLGCAVGDTESEDFWSEFFRSLRARGLRGVRLITSDHHEGLKNAIGKCFVGAGWQRCRVHAMRNVLAKVPKADSEMVAAAIRTIFAQPSAEAVAAQFDRIVATLEPKFPVVAGMLVDARDDLLQFSGFPIEHWRKIWSTNPLERLHRVRLTPSGGHGVFGDHAASRVSSYSAGVR
jgi:putative transposase